MADSEGFCCCSNIFHFAKVADIVEIVLTTLSIVVNIINGNVLILGMLILLPYLVVEFFGIHKKNKCLILFGCVIRILETTLVVIGTIIGFCLFFGAAALSPASNLSDQEM